MKFHRSYSDSDGYFAEINVTPLVDVMLVLLVVFLVTAPFIPSITHSVNLNLPEENGNLITPRQLLVISVDDAGKFYWNEQEVNETTLQENLKNFKLTHPNSNIQLRADTKANYGAIVKVLAAAQKYGVLNLELLTQPAKRE